MLTHKDATKAAARALDLLHDMKYPNALPLAIIALCTVFSGRSTYAAETKDGDSMNTAAFLRRANVILSLSHDSPHVTLFRLYKAARIEFVGKQLSDDDLAHLRPNTPPEDTAGDKSFVAWLPVRENRTVAFDGDRFYMWLKISRVVPLHRIWDVKVVLVAARHGIRPHRSLGAPDEQRMLTPIWRGALHLPSVKSRMKRFGEPSAVIVSAGDLSSINYSEERFGFAIDLRFTQNADVDPISVKAYSGLVERSHSVARGSDVILRLPDGWNICSNKADRRSPLCAYFDE